MIAPPGSAEGVVARRLDDGATMRRAPEMRRRAAKDRRREIRSPVGAAPAGGARNPAPGRPWVAVRPHYEGPPFGGLDAARTKGGESCPDRGPTRVPSASGSYGPGEQKSPPWSAERRPRSPKENAARRKTVAPLGAPLPRHLARGEKLVPAKAGKTTAYPAPQRIRAMTLALARAGQARRIRLLNSHR